MNHEQIERIRQLYSQLLQAEAAFLAELKNEGYETIGAGGFDDEAKYYLVHPEYSDKAKENSNFYGINEDWLKSLLAGAVFQSPSLYWTELKQEVKNKETKHD
jgi:hypothetical protein